MGTSGTTSSHDGADHGIDHSSAHLALNTVSEQDTVSALGISHAVPSAH
jgi:hypothetical protein